MQIPDHLVDLVVELAETNLEQARGDVRTLDAIPTINNLPHAIAARRRLARLAELVAYFHRAGRVAA